MASPQPQTISSPPMGDPALGLRCSRSFLPLDLECHLGILQREVDERVAQGRVVLGVGERQKTKDFLRNAAASCGMISSSGARSRGGKHRPHRQARVDLDLTARHPIASLRSPALSAGIFYMRISGRAFGGSTAPIGRSASLHADIPRARTRHGTVRANCRRANALDSAQCGQSHVLLTLISRSLGALNFLIRPRDASSIELPKTGLVSF